MSSNVPRRACVRLARAVAALLVVCAAARGAAEDAPWWRVATLSGSALDCLRGAEETHIALFACRARCAPIPWQLDERAADGQLALPGGPRPSADDPPGVVDDNDELLWMVGDSGRRMRSDEAPAEASCRVALTVRSGAYTGWVYAFVLPAPAPRSPLRYVSYEPDADVVRGAHVALGFGAPTPRALFLSDAAGAPGPNLLDRLKVRARTRFLGFIPLGRDEDDIEREFGAWKAGPIRVVRREWQWVRLAPWLRTPIFEIETFVYRDWLELPVRLRLNFPPTYFFAGIEIQAVLDFRDLRGWRFVAPGAPPLRVGDADAAAVAAVNRRDGTWLALAGPLQTMVLHLQLGDTLGTLRSQLVYRENDGGQGPEAVAGEQPAVGFRLTEWGRVDRGRHWFAARSYAVPPDTDLAEFARAEAAPVIVEAETLPPP